MYMCYPEKRGNPLATERPPDVFPISLTGFFFLREIGLKCSYSYTKFTQSFISTYSFLFQNLPYIHRSIDIITHSNHKNNLNQFQNASHQCQVRF